jgi:hypothetical protein
VQKSRFIATHEKAPTHLGPWRGGLEYRYLGDYPLSSGGCLGSAAVKGFATSCANAPTALR